MAQKETLSELMLLDMFDSVALIGKSLVRLHTFRQTNTGQTEIEAGYSSVRWSDEAIERIRKLLELANILWACDNRLEDNMSPDELTAIAKAKKMVDTMLVGVDSVIRKAVEDEYNKGKI